MKFTEYIAEEKFLDIHPFEKAGLGKAPYSYIGMEKKIYKPHADADAMPGGTCNYCSTGIMYCFWVKSADGKKFYVGSECIMKIDKQTATTDVQRANAPLVRAVRDAKRKMVSSREDERIKAALDFVDQNEEFRQVLNAIPRSGRPAESMLNWVRWMRKNAGHAGYMQITKYIEGMLKKDWKHMPKIPVSNKPSPKPELPPVGIPGPDKSSNPYTRRQMNAFHALKTNTEFRKWLEKQLHPKGIKRLNMLDYVQWMWDNGFAGSKLTSMLETEWEDCFEVDLMGVERPGSYNNPQKY